MRRSNFTLRAPPTLLAEARKAAESEGVALNRLITLALAEKVSARRPEEYFEERARRADPARVSRILARVGKGNRLVESDELPLEFPARKARKKKCKEISYNVDILLPSSARVSRLSLCLSPGFWVQHWVQLEQGKGLPISCKRHQIGHLGFSQPRLLTDRL